MTESDEAVIRGIEIAWKSSIRRNVSDGNSGTALNPRG